LRRTLAQSAPQHSCFCRIGKVKQEEHVIESIVIWLIVGAIAGWLAGVVMRGGGFGLIGDIVVGVIGGVIAGWLLPLVHFPLIGGPYIGAIIEAFIGACILLFVLRLVKR
jgi:uncharacterized membrane protein YeaQ/YmgE (transglycosylase-associated protein family)